MQHLISTGDFTKDEILKLFDDARIFLDMEGSEVLKGKVIVNLFFENSTRTRGAFEMAAKRLGASVISLDVGTSSTAKGETIFDTVMNINAMRPDAIIIRHSDCNFHRTLVDYVNCPIINAGAGKNAHPTQALLDLFTITEHFDGQTEGKKVAIVGDIKSSRVAGSNKKLLPRFGMEVVFVAPDCFKSEDTEYRQVDNISEIIDEIDVVMSLRTQLERHNEIYFQSLHDYAKDYCITKDTFGDRDILLLHPGPVNRNVDISDEMLVDPRNKILEQVRNGVAVRMAVLKKLVVDQKK
jgi:aspartate carbamoyltransferase catalytic subunit